MNARGKKVMERVFELLDQVFPFLDSATELINKVSEQLQRKQSTEPPFKFTCTYRWSVSNTEVSLSIVAEYKLAKGEYEIPVVHKNYETEFFYNEPEDAVLKMVYKDILNEIAFEPGKESILKIVTGKADYLNVDSPYFNMNMWEIAEEQKETGL